MAVELLVSPIVEKFVSSVADAIAGQLRAAWGLHGALQKMQRRLLRIQSVLAAAEEKQTVDTAVKAWLEALKKVAYEAEDVLDELNYETLRHKAAEVAGDKTPCMGEVRDFFSSHNPVLIRLRMGRKLNNLLQEMDQLAEESKKFDLSDVGHAQPEAAAPDMDETCSFVEESQVVGRHEKKDELVKMLIDNNGDAENVAVLPIVGMGGLGKTTVAQLIYNDPQVAGYFNWKRWVCISDTWDVKVIIQKILSSATMTTMEDLYQDLRKQLADKRFLIVLDDVWEEDPIKWNNLKGLLNCGDKGSSIIVTTRSQSVSEITGTLKTCHLSYLAEKESWELFSKRAFGSEAAEKPEELVDIGKAIANKCGGLPLALVMLGSLLRTERDKKQWLEIKDSGIWNTETRILPALRLSYKHLPLHSKQCFAFCAIFPKDYEMDKEKLIKLWMAHGFIPSHQGGGSLEAKGNGIFKQLVQRSFLQDLKEEMVYNRIRTTCGMHDLVHDLALSIAGNDCVAIQEGFSQHAVMKDAYHLFFSKAHGLDIKDMLKASPYLRTIFMNRESMDALKVSGSTSLRVLGVGAIGVRLPSSMKYLQHLRYLHLRDPSVSELPESICTLLNLQTLRLSDCWKLQRLPERMACMISLRHLYLDGCHKLMKMPPGMGRMTNLQTLTLYVVSEETGRGIGELKDLHLSSRLKLTNLGCVKDAKEAREMNLHSKDLHVLLLDLSTGGGGGEGEEMSNVEEVLEELKPPSCLKLLEIRDYQGLNCPKWTADALLQNLQRLDLKECRGLHRLPPLWQLSSLEELTLQHLDNLKYIISDNKADAAAAADDTTARAFRSLKTLELDGLGSLEEWWENRSNAMPNCFPALVRLEIRECPELAGPIPLAPCLNLLDVSSSPKIPLGSVSALTSLVCLRINIFGSWEEGRSTSVADDSFVFVPHETVALRNLQCLEVLEIAGRTAIPLAWWLHEDENKDEKEEEEEEEEEEGSGHSSSLKELVLDNQCDWIFSWPRYSGFWTSLASLERLIIYRLDALVALPCEALQGLKSLRQLEINMCRRLKCLGLEGLTALRSLTLVDCTDLTSLTSPEQVLTTLKELRVRRCPQLQRKCETGGEYWSLVSNIPVLLITDDD